MHKKVKRALICMVALMLTVCCTFSVASPAVYALATSGVVAESEEAAVEPGSAVSVDPETESAALPASENGGTEESDAPDSPGSGQEAAAVDEGQGETDKSESAADDTVVTPGEETNARETAEPEGGEGAVSEAEGSETESGSEEPAAGEEGEGVDVEGAEEGEEAEEPEEPLVLFALQDPEENPVLAQIGDEVTLSANPTREDVEVLYQWQRLQKRPEGVSSDARVYDYADGEPTWYNYVIEDIPEMEAASEGTTWPGMETWYAVMAALEDAGYDFDELSLAWRTPNYALDGYAFSAEVGADGQCVVYAEKDGVVHAAVLNSEGKWEFSSEETSLPDATWVNIEGATEKDYTFTVDYEDYDATFRCMVTVVDQEYKEAVAQQLNESGAGITEEQIAQDQILYTVYMSVTDGSEPVSGEDDPLAMLFGDEPLTFGMMRSAMVMAASTASAGNPALSADAQWITGLTGTYEYITKETYDRVTEWLNAGQITQEQADLYWTYLGGPSGFEGRSDANVLDENGFPTGETRKYNGFDLTDGNMLEVNSDWYGKTVYFRQAKSGQSWSVTGTAIDIPAYTSLTMDENGNYVAGASGSRYKEAISVLNAYVPDVGSVYKLFVTSSNVAPSGWLLDNSGNQTNLHISIYTVDVEKFNADPQRYLMDAEGTYRMDSFAWGVSCYDEPDISGKAYWVLKDYLANGYGLMVGHDTMYAYAGAFYDAWGVDMDESTIDPNDGTTWSYDVNSWLPGTTASRKQWNQTTQSYDILETGNTSRGGHFYLNQLMGSNAGNAGVADGETDSSVLLAASKSTARVRPINPYSSVSMILSAGGSNGIYSKRILYGGTSLYATYVPYSAAAAQTAVKLRTPTNFPYDMSVYNPIPAALTHTNNQVAFGTIWVRYANTNEYSQSMNESAFTQYDYLETPRYFTIDDNTGTNNFYLAGTGNFLMNQVGHLPQNSAKAAEARLTANALFYVSQRKECEICAANQGEQQDVHFVRRINSANADAVLTALQNGGSYWYPIDGCYQLTEDITLPEDWTPIEHFSGHWNSDVYKVTLNSSGTPLLANDSADGESGWNLGTDVSKGTPNVFSSSSSTNKRTTGVARVVGDMNDLFSTSTNYAGYTVKILGTDNPKYMGAGEVYDCTVNTDSKYVISNLPCVFDTGTKSGILRVRAYDTAGNEVTQYGTIRVNVAKEFWDNDETIPLYLGGFTAYPAADEVTYESAQAFFSATALADDKITLARWEYRTSATDTWKTIPSAWDTTITQEQRITADGDNTCETSLTLNNTDPAWDGYEFRAVFTSSIHGTWSSYDYWITGTKGNLSTGTQYKNITSAGYSGKLTVLLWPAYAEQSQDKTVYDGENATFTSVGYALADGTHISASWQYSTVGFDPYNGGDFLEWHDIDGSSEFGGLQTVSTQSQDIGIRIDISNALSDVNPASSLVVFAQNAGFESVKTTLTVKQVDIKQSGTHFRVHYTAESAHGTTYDWYSDIADELTFAWTTSTGTLGGVANSAIANYSNILNVQMPELTVVTTPTALTEGASNPDTMTPDEYGQMLLIPRIGGSVANGTAVYEAIIYYKPGTHVPTPTWQYMTFLDQTPKFWAQSDAASSNVAHSLGYSDVTVKVVNEDLGLVTGGTYDGCYAIKSVMTLTNVPLSMYNSESMLKYYFRCMGTVSYSTVKGNKSNSQVDKWGGLVMDYAIALHHNGVMTYGVKNIINGQTVTTPGGIATATTNMLYSTWQYPSLTIKVPSGRHVNSAIVYFDSSVAHDSRDAIIYDAAGIDSLGIMVSEASNDKLVLISKTMDTVELDAWHQALREYVSFKTYDNATFTAASITSGTTGGAKIRWVVDELRLSGVTVDPNGGHAYKVVSTADIINWEDANVQAQQYNTEMNTNGYLAEINSAGENEFVKSLLGGSTAYIGGKRTGGTWSWAKSGSGFAYANWSGGTVGTNTYLAMNGDGTWSSFEPNVDTTQNIVLANLGRPAQQAILLTPTSVSQYVNLVSNHQYYMFIRFGDYFDANAGGPIIFNAFGIYADCNEANSWNNWISLVDGVYAFGGTSGSYPCTFQWLYTGTDYSGHYCSLFAMDIFDLTAAFGAGNEPDLSWCRTNLRSSEGTFVTWRPTITKTYTVKNVTDIRKYVVEYEIPSLAFAATDHSAEDETYIGTKVTTDIDQDKEVLVNIQGNSKLYDGTVITPSSFTVVGSEGASLSLFNVTYTASVAGNHANYATRTLSGTDWQNTGAKNATKYHVSVSLTSAAQAAGWVLDPNSVLECDLIIYQRPIFVYSTDNDKVYDGTSSGVISNIQKEGLTATSGVIAGDIVTLNTTTVFGYYTLDGANETIHNSTTNNGGNEWVMKRNASLSDLYIMHTSSSDPYYNYYLAGETYSGHIAQRPVQVHSLYLEDPDNPRNVKAYDGTADAIIQNIVLNNVVSTDNVTLRDSIMFGTYETSQAGETLNADGSTQTDRMKKLQENRITPSASAQLTGNDFGDYFIESEEYSGAIYRATLVAQVKGWRGMYGNGMPEAPWADTNAYKNGVVADPNCWLTIDGLKGSDTLHLTTTLSDFATKVPGQVPTWLPDATTSVGSYELTYKGLTEANYPVLSNYIIQVMNAYLTIYPRTITVTVNSDDKMTGEANPVFHSSFEMQQNDGETYALVGNDALTSYVSMALCNSDTVGNTVVVHPQTRPDITQALTMTGGISNITYLTTCSTDSPALYLVDETDLSVHPCDFCEAYYGFATGTDHWTLSGYGVSINTDSLIGTTLDIAYVTNEAGEQVQNYELVLRPGTLTVHPTLRFQLKATVPMYVCMYGYNGDGSVVTPENYGITNYSNGAIEVLNINVSDDGWIIRSDKGREELLRGEMYMQLQDTALDIGNNAPANRSRWVVGKGNPETNTGTFLNIPVNAYMAGGNVNEAGESFLVRVNYTIGEYGKTLPVIPGLVLPESVGGQPVTGSTTDQHGINSRDYTA